jgi:nitroreductase
VSRHPFRQFFRFSLSHIFPLCKPVNSWYNWFITQIETPSGCAGDGRNRKARERKGGIDMATTTSEAIRARRSVRKFKEGVELSQAQIDSLLEAAMMAPSARNLRPWEFVVVQNRGTMEELRKAHPFSSMLKSASLAIVLCALPAGEEYGFFQQDCGAAAENLLLQAVDLGLAACWCGVYPKEERVVPIRKILGVDSLPVALIAIGAADEEPVARGFYDKSKVRYIV